VDIEDRIEELVTEISIKSGYGLRLLHKAVEEIKRLRVSEAALLVQLDGLKDALAQAEGVIEDLREEPEVDWIE
jgi:hypothetical protein